MNVSEEIKRLHELHLAGALSDAEFAQAKAKLLGGIKQDQPGTSYGDGPANDLVQEFSRLCRLARRRPWRSTIRRRRRR